MSVGRAGDRAAEALSRYWRTGDDRFLHCRRRVVALNLVAAGALGAVAVYQIGLVRHLPEPPLPFLDADRVDASGEAYATLRMPDALLGIGSAAVTAALAGAGGRDRSPWLALATAAKALLDAGAAVYLTTEQWSRHRAFCLYCLTSAAANLLALPATFPEARAALARLRRAA